ncbi:MAG: cohesin domain-containing protein [Patescibacteria group bacterium]
MNFLPTLKNNEFVRPFLVFGFLLFSIIGVAAYLQQRQDVRKKAAGEQGSVELVLSSPAASEEGKVSVGQGEIFDVPIALYTDTPLSAVDIVLNFDETVLELIDVQEGSGGNFATFVPVVGEGEFAKDKVVEEANASGEIAFGAVTFDYASDSVTEAQALPLEVLSTLSFKALEPGGQTTIDFQFSEDSNDFADSNAFAYESADSDEQIVDVLAGTKPLDIAVTGGVEIPVGIRLEQVNEEDRNVPIEKVSTVDCHLSVGGKSKTVKLERSAATDYFNGQALFSLPSGTYTVTASVDKFLPRSLENISIPLENKDNLTFDVLLGGNVNDSGDSAGKIDMADIVTIISRYNGSVEAFPESKIYSPDINFDGKVDMLDVLLAVANYGKSGS